MQIEILIESDFDAHRGFLLPRIADKWRESGHRVGTRRLSELPGQADVSFLHVDRSVVDPELVAPHARAGRLINAKTLDITKRNISSQLCHRDDPPNGPVILKSNLNSGGGPERVRAPRAIMPVRVLQSLRRRLPWRLSHQLGDYELPILENVTKVPGWVWRSDDIVVERFVPERDGDLFVTRSWSFLGSAEHVLVRTSTEHVVKAGNLSDEWFEETVPRTLRALRESLGFDFGKFDYVMNDGAPILLDANRTPSMVPVTDRHREIHDQLAKGIEAFR